MSLGKTENEPPIAIVFVADGLRASALGAYGNTIFPTETLDQLAADSSLFDWAHSDAPNLQDAMRSVIFNTHVLSPSQRPHLAEQVAGQGGYSILFTDDEAVAESEFGRGFDRCIQVETEADNGLAANASETHLAKFFAELLEVTLMLQPGNLLWIHCRAMYGDWDAPLEYRQRIASLEDPDPLEFSEPPKGVFHDRENSEDLLLGYQQAYAAQVGLFDELLGHYFSQAATLLDSALFGLTAFRGYPLGEHLIVGQTEKLFSENLHVPLLVRLPISRLRGCRFQNLVQPAILYSLVTDWFSDGEHTKTLDLLTPILVSSQAEFVAASSSSEKSFRTQAWNLVRDGNGSKLFVKPDDRWEINDVSSRCVDIVAKMEATLSDCVRKFHSASDRWELKMPDEITQPLD